MAIQYLNSINLNKNQLQNAVIHVLGTPPGNPVQGQVYYNSTDKRLYFFDGTIWIDASGDIKSVNSSTINQLTVTDPNGPNPQLTIVTGAIMDGGLNLATTGDIYTYVTNQISNINIGVNGTLNEIDVNGSLNTTIGVGDVLTIGLPNDVTISNDLTVTNDTTILSDLTVNGNVLLGNSTLDSVIVAGNLTVNGTTTSVNSNTVNIGDSIITLNSDEAGSPSQDAGIEIERGTSANRSLIWDESAGFWTVQQNTGVYERIATYADSVEDVTVAATAGSGINVTETLSGTDNRIKNYDLALDFADFSYKTSIGDGSTLSYPVNHNLGSQDVIVQLYDASSFETVYADVIRNTINQVTVTFANAPSASDIRVLIQKL